MFPSSSTLDSHMSLKKLIDQLARLCEKEDHHPSIRWFEGEDPYW